MLAACLEPINKILIIPICQTGIVSFEPVTTPPCTKLRIVEIFIKLISVLAHHTHSGADNCKNRSNYDTNNRFGKDTLWGSLFKKKTRATQNFNMAAIFQDGRHGVSWIRIFVLEMAVNGQRKLLWQQSVCFWHAKCTVNVMNTIQMFRVFQYGRQFPRWPPSAIV